METVNNLLLNRVFTRNTFYELLDTAYDETYCAAVNRYISSPSGKNQRQIINEIYEVLNNEYRNEYYYKNTLLNKLLLGIHSPATTIALSEVPVGKSKADFILINGKAVVYEIKTELDNLDRLESQLVDYSKAFSNVCVVTSESSYKTVKKKLYGSNVGIYVLTKRNTISLRKESIEDFSNINLNTIFKILRKNEYENIIKTYYGELPSVSQFSYYSECKKLFEAIDKDLAYKLFISELKKRKKIDVDLFKQVPKELKSIVYFSEYKAGDYYKLNEFLLSEFGG